MSQSQTAANPRHHEEEKNEALPGGLGNGDNFFRGTGEHRQFWGTRNIENQDFDFGKQGNNAIFSRGTREQVPHWEGQKK